VISVGGKTASPYVTLSALQLEIEVRVAGRMWSCVVVCVSLRSGVPIELGT
jgi:hypothetical protein